VCVCVCDTLSREWPALGHTPRPEEVGGGPTHDLFRHTTMAALLMAADDGDESTLVRGNEKFAVLMVRVVISGMSLVSCLIVLIAVIALHRYRSVTGRLVMVLTSTVALSAASNLLTPLVTLDDSLCVIQAVTMQLGDISSAMWTVIIAFNLFFVLVAKKQEKNIEIWYHLIGWPIPIVLTLLPSITDSYGHVAVWCWIRSEGTGNIWRFACLYVPLMISFIIIIFLYLLIFLRLSRVFKKSAWAKTDDLINKENRLLRSLFIFPIIFLAIWTFPTINRIYGWITGNHAVFVLLLIHSITACLQGFLNSLVYGLNSKARKRLSELLCPRNKQRQSLLEQETRKQSTYLDVTSASDSHAGRRPNQSCIE